MKIRHGRSNYCGCIIYPVVPDAALPLLPTGLKESRPGGQPPQSQPAQLRAPREIILPRPIPHPGRVPVIAASARKRSPRRCRHETLSAVKFVIVRNHFAPAACGASLNWLRRIAARVSPGLNSSRHGRARRALARRPARCRAGAHRAGLILCSAIWPNSRAILAAPALRRFGPSPRGIDGGGLPDLGAQPRSRPQSPADPGAGPAMRRPQPAAGVASSRLVVRQPLATLARNPPRRISFPAPGGGGGL